MNQVYFDTSVWCRPFDKLDHEKITEEFNKIVEIIQNALDDKLEIVSSSAVFVETSLIEPVKRVKVETLIERVATVELRPTDKTQGLAEKIALDCGLKPMDAVHIALAVENDVQVFLTTDRELYLYKKNCIHKYGVVVKNPREYNMVYEGL